jgi:ubiquinone/menaquinone biosynthesis C-methylase UbiE
MTEPLGAFDPTTTYDQAVTEYESASSDFWRYLSDHTVDLLQLQPGERVLDVPCGTGHSALKAAERVGPTGRIVALDVSERMVQLVRAKAARLRTGNIDAGVADMTRLGTPDAAYDAVICVLGIFFVPDMPAALRRLAAQARPGGRIGVAVFGESFFEPLRTTFVEAVHHVAPDVEVVEPWSRVATHDELRELSDAAGLHDVIVDERVDHLPLASPDDWWRIVLGSGLRSTIAQLDASASDEVHARCTAAIAREHVDSLTTTSRYVVATP